MINGSENNTIIGNPELINSNIEFKGTGNILFCEEDVRLENSTLGFFSNDAVVYLSSNKKHNYKVKMDIWRSSTIFVGRDNYFNNIMSISASERRSVLIGGGGVFSFDVWLRTSDPHLVYDADTKQRINISDDVVIGDHVWLGQSALILKGSKVGSGSVIGGASVLAGKNVPSNTVYAGNPAREVRSNIFFTGASVHNYTKKKTKESMVLDTDKYIYTKDANGSMMEDICGAIEKTDSPEQRLEIVKDMIVSGNEMRRFAIGRKSQSKKKSIFGGLKK